MRKLALVLASALLTALAASGAVSAGATACPKGALAFGANPIGPAAAAALKADRPKNRPLVTGATIATDDTARGPQAKRECGRTVWQRTVVVYVLDRAMLPSQSLSQRVFFVSRGPGGYRVWETVR